MQGYFVRSYSSLSEQFGGNPIFIQTFHNHAADLKGPRNRFALKDAYVEGDGSLTSRSVSDWRRRTNSYLYPLGDLVSECFRIARIKVYKPWRRIDVQKSAEHFRSKKNFVSSFMRKREAFFFSVRRYMQYVRLMP